MTSSAYMKNILEVLVCPMTMKDLVKLTGRHESNIRRALKDMQELALVKQIMIDRDGMKYKAWERY